MDFKGFAAKNMTEKIKKNQQESEKNVNNIVVDRNRYDEVLKLQTIKVAIKEGQSLPDYIRTYCEGTHRFQMKNLYDKPA